MAAFICLFSFCSFKCFLKKRCIVTLVTFIWTVSTLGFQLAPQRTFKGGYMGVALKNLIFYHFWAKNRPWRPTGQHGQHKKVVILVPVMMVTKKVGQFPKKMDFGPKNCIFDPKLCVFYATPMKPPFLWLGRSLLNGMTTPPYPEGTLDTFGFLVGGRLATRRAVSWPRLPKVGPFEVQKCCFRQYYSLVEQQVDI